MNEAACGLDFLYRDQRLCALNKPAGIMVHYSRITTDREFLLDRLREHLGCRVFPVHRLDRATSGVLLFALDAEAAADLGRQFEAGRVAKRYLAVVRGWVEEEGEIDKPLTGAGNKTRKAITRFRRLAATEIDAPVPPHPTARYSLVEITPLTGRTHQIRRHFNHIAHPIVGDVRHGDRRHNRLFRARLGCHRLLLHALSLGFDHPETGRPVELTAPLPADFRAATDALGWAETTSAVECPL